MKKILSLSFIFFCLGLFIVGCSTSRGGHEDDIITIRLPMGYIPSVQQAPFYVAVEKGYFAEEGIELEFDYSFETDGVALVGANKLPFALVSGEQVLMAREQELPVVYIAAWYQEYPVAVVAKTASGINTPKDLVGKSLGLPGLYGANYIGLRAMLDAEGIQEDEVNLESINYTQVENLAKDQVDAVSVYISNEPIQLRAQGYDIVVIPVSDYVHLASNGIITNEYVIKNNPELVERFVTAFQKGLIDTINDPDQAYEICKNYVESLVTADEGVQKQVLAASIELWKTDKPGYIDPVSWENMETVLLNMGLLDNPIDLNAAYTNQFVE